jgi:hypothetical protein
MSRQTLSLILLTAAVLLATLALATLAPYPSALRSDLGYYTLCPFAPWSTLTLIMLAGLAWVVRGHIRRLQA